MKHPIPKGVFDILPKDPSPDGTWRESHLWQYLEQTFSALAKSYGYREIRTPIFERTELFVRGVGESSDIVNKEMYTFEDKAGRMMTLRPECTAPVMRAFVEKRLDQHVECHKLFYIGPMFRYERPQAGRYRQLHQIGIEAVGDPSPEQDVEVIDLLCELFRRLGLTNLTVLLNCIGEAKAREMYKAALKMHLEPKFSELSEESQIRFEKNILRILDSKDPKDQALLKGIPSILDYLSEDSRHHFNQVKSLLDRLGISYVVTPHLVRGLDYYNGTVFEVTAGELGAQNALGAGGRYDSLTQLLGGPDLPAVGFAAGIERLLQTMLAQKVPLPSPPNPTLFIIPIGDKAKEFGTELTFSLRHAGISVEMDWHPKKVGKSLEKAARLQATFALVLGEKELQSGKIQIKHLSKHEEIPLNLDQMKEFLLGSEKNFRLE